MSRWKSSEWWSLTELRLTTRQERTTYRRDRNHARRVRHDHISRVTIWYLWYGQAYQHLPLLVRSKLGIVVRLLPALSHLRISNSILLGAYTFTHKSTPPIAYECDQTIFCKLDLLPHLFPRRYEDVQQWVHHHLTSYWVVICMLPYYTHYNEYLGTMYLYLLSCYICPRH